MTSTVRTLLPAPAAALLFVFIFGSPAYAQAGLNTGDTAWMLTASALVLLMTIPGVALFYAGLVRKKNVLSIVMQTFTTVCVVAIIWTVIGYTAVFTDGGELNDIIGGFSKMTLRGIGRNSLVGTVPESVYVMFQMTFAIITVALITGAFAERMKFHAFILFIALWTIFVYLPIAHWVWGGGFLSKRAVLDYAGGTVVHLNAGTAGLVAALVLGKRFNYGRERMEPYNIAMCVVGASFLWVGWFGFNAGSAVAANGSAGMAMLVTQIAAAAGGLAWMFAEAAVHRRIGVVGISCGAVAGLVAITPGSGYVDAFGAMVMGLAAGLVCFLASMVVKRAWHYDDPLDVFGVHAVGGIVGTVLTGVFAMESIGGVKGLIEGNSAQVFIQCQGVAVTLLWSAVMTFVILKFVDLLVGLRVTSRAEVEGLDIHLHGEYLG